LNASVADIATDAFNHARVRTTAVPDRRGRPPGGGGAGANAGGVGGPKVSCREGFVLRSKSNEDEVLSQRESAREG
jgi:hypothetical protein